ncbi:MAG: hypothetical protein P8174_09650 [Gemmatimonadota bacterium]|jgi:hypothetical protein
MGRPVVRPPPLPPSHPNEAMAIELEVNGRAHRLDVDPERKLLGV